MANATYPQITQKILSIEKESKGENINNSR